MAFSREWEESYRAGAHLSVWPWSDLVSYVYRYARPSGRAFKVLELGCGAGANIRLFRELGASYHAVEGSRSIVARLRKAFPECGDRIAVGDFTRSIPFDVEFDLVVDRSALTFSGTPDIRRTLGMIHRRLKAGGAYVGVDWFSTRHSDFKKGRPQGADRYTRCGIQEGHLAGLGPVHFSDKKHLVDLFSAFHVEVLEHKLLKRERPADGRVVATWNFVARKEAR